MKSFRFFILYLCMSPALCGQALTSQNSSALVLEHVTVIDSTGSPPRQDVSVLIVGDKIKSIFPSSQIKPVPDVIAVDAKGKFLIAGLWDMHVHALSKNQPEPVFPIVHCERCYRRSEYGRGHSTAANCSAQKGDC